MQPVWSIESALFDDPQSLTINVLQGFATSGTMAASLTALDGPVQPMGAINGTLGDDTLNGTAGNDTIMGYAGNDLLTGKGGNDLLNGGDGNDTLKGGTGDDIYYVNAVGDKAVELLDEGYDVVLATCNWTLGANFEDLVLLGSAIKGIGNALDNVITGNLGDNLLRGLGGDDILCGGTGLDTLQGGTGDDIYMVDSTEVVVTEKADEGMDTVISTVSWTLANNVENLQILGTATNGIGNNLNNCISGNTADNLLRGNGGNDLLLGIGGENSLFGGGGKDTLTGGIDNDILNGGNGKDVLIGATGNDTFVFDSVLNATSNIDRIEDFVAVDDTICLDKTIFGKLTVGALKAGQFLASDTGKAADANDYILYNTSTGALLYDADGSGSGAALNFAILLGVPTITYDDFTVVA